MRKALILMAVCLLANTAKAQQTLQVEDLSNPLDVYTSIEDQAALRVRCHQDLSLSFSSTHDERVIPFKKDLEGNDSIYYFEFPTGKEYRGRILTIMSPGYTLVEVPLELSPKQLVTLRVFDPNSLVDAGCYRKHRNQGMAELKKGNYTEARNQFDLASQCSDTDPDENFANLRKVDSLIVLRQEADINYDLSDYAKASEIYSRIIGLNPYDEYANERLNECNNKFSSECTITFKKAEAYFNEREYEKAKELYEKIIKKECFQAPMAADRITSIDRFMTSKKYHATVLTYEWTDGAPIGFHIGRYNMHKAGGYFHMNINQKIFDALRNAGEIGDNPEAQFGFGWTLKIANPIWIHFGPGLGAKLYYGDYKKDKYPDKKGKPVDPEDVKDEDRDKLNASFSVNPEIGVTIKHSYFAIRATYFYRFAMKKELEDYMGRHHFMLGIGVAF